MRKYIGRILRPIAMTITDYMEPPRVIHGREVHDVYLSRWYLFGNRPEVDEHGSTTLDNPDRISGKFNFNVFMHRFHRSDDDSALHTHPWRWSLSFVLAGGYREFYPHGDAVRSRYVRPLSFNFIRHDKHHRVVLLEEDCWSIFLAGPRISTWYFWDPITKLTAHWRDFLDAKSQGLEPNWFRAKGVTYERA